MQKCSAFGCGKAEKQFQQDLITHFCISLAVFEHRKTKVSDSSGSNSSQALLQNSPEFPLKHLSLLFGYAHANIQTTLKMSASLLASGLWRGWLNPLWEQVQGPQPSLAGSGGEWGSLSLWLFLSWCGPWEMNLHFRCWAKHFPCCVWKTFWNYKILINSKCIILYPYTSEVLAHFQSFPEPFCSQSQSLWNEALSQHSLLGELVCFHLFGFVLKRVYHGDCALTVSSSLGWLAFSRECLTKLLGHTDPQGACSWHRYLIFSCHNNKVQSSSGNIHVLLYGKTHKRGQRKEAVFFSCISSLTESSSKGAALPVHVPSSSALPEWHPMHPWPPGCLHRENEEVDLQGQKLEQSSFAPVSAVTVPAQIIHWWMLAKSLSSRCGYGEWCWVSLVV